MAAIGDVLKRKRRVSPPLMFSQRNNPYCELVHFVIANINDFSYQNEKKAYF